MEILFKLCKHAKHIYTSRKKLDICNGNHETTKEIICRNLSQLIKYNHPHIEEQKALVMPSKMCHLRAFSRILVLPNRSISTPVDNHVCQLGAVISIRGNSIICLWFRPGNLRVPSHNTIFWWWHSLQFIVAQMIHNASAKCISEHIYRGPQAIPSNKMMDNPLYNYKIINYSYFPKWTIKYDY